MDEFKPYGELSAAVHVSLTEAEAKALDAIAGYGADAFLKVFYEHLGKHYLQPYEKGLRSLFEKARHEVPGVTRQIDEARAVFRGSKVGISQDDLKRLRDAAGELRDLKAAAARSSSHPADDRPTEGSGVLSLAPDTDLPSASGSEQQ